LALLAAFAGQGHAQSPPALVEVADGAVIFNGQINANSAARFLRLLQDRTVTRLVITSRGGIVSAALDMADAIHERQLDVEVPSACHSSCANYIFPAGRRKLVGRPGAVAWHGNMAHILYLQQTAQASWDENLAEGARQLAGREAEFFRRIGVDGFVCWFAKIEPYKVEGSYYLSASDMERFGIRDVTVREAGPGESDPDGVRPVHVDWAGLEAARPSVRFDR
jgi:hypothetical protein